MSSYRCCELVDHDTGYLPIAGGYWHCGAEAQPPVVLDRCEEGAELEAIGRAKVHAGPYCEEHGGHRRALATAYRDWSYLAPVHVGGHMQVQRAGCRSLCSEHAVIVIRREEDEQRPERYRVRITRDQWREICEREATGRTLLRAMGLACCAYETTVRSEAQRRVDQLKALWGVDREVEILPGGPRPRKRSWLAQVGVGSHMRQVGAYATRDEAIKAATVSWEKGLEQEVSEIMRARGGTLEWGMPIRPRTSPILVEPAPGQSSWDAYVSRYGWTPK